MKGPYVKVRKELVTWQKFVINAKKCVPKFLQTSIFDIINTVIVIEMVLVHTLSYNSGTAGTGGAHALAPGFAINIGIILS